MNYNDLAQLCVLDKDFEEVSERFDVYCPFEALKVSRQEIRHSNFLADILDPSHSHQFGDQLLRSFIDKVLEQSGDDRLRLSLHLNEITHVEILREWQHMDLVCVVVWAQKTLVIALEIKIESGEHGDQLEKYSVTLEREWPKADRRQFFLTPAGDPPTHEQWFAVSFSQVLDGFEDCLNADKGTNTSRMMVSSYIDMMRRRYLPDEDLEELARKIWSKHNLALQYLIEQKPNIIREASKAIQSTTVFSEIRDRILESTGIRIELDSCSNTYVRIAVPDWDQAPEMLCSDWTASKRVFMCELELYGKRVHIRMQFGPGEPEKRQSLYERMMSASNIDTGRNTKLTPAYTRMAAKTLVRIDNVDEMTEAEDLAELVEKTQKGVVEFLSGNLPAYQSAILQF